MKKFIITLLLLLCGTMLFAETYILNTSQGKKELYIPDNPKELREAYIEMSSLYVEERFSHEESLEQINSLLKLHDDYKEFYMDLETTTRDLIRELMKDDTDFLRFYVAGHYRYNLLNPFFNIGIGIKVQFFESLIIGIFYEVPTSVGVSISGKLY